MAREFNYDVKDSYTPEELAAILEQHAKFLDVDGLKGQVDALNGELTPIKQEKRNAQLQGLVGDLTDPHKVDAAIKLAGITDEDDDETVKSKVQEVISQNDFLGKTPVTDKAGIKVESEGETEEVESDDEDEKSYMKNL